MHAAIMQLRTYCYENRLSLRVWAVLEGSSEEFEKDPTINHLYKFSQLCVPPKQSITYLCYSIIFILFR